MLNRSKHEMILPGGLRYVAQRRPWTSRREGLEKSLKRSLFNACGDTYPAHTHIERDREQAILFGISACKANLPEMVDSFSLAMSSLDDASYSIKQGKGSFQYEDVATRRLEADRDIIENVVRKETLRKRFSLDEGDVAEEKPDGEIEVRRADGRIQRVAPDGSLVDVEKPKQLPAKGSASASRSGRKSSSGEAECGFADLESTRDLYEENLALLREGGQPGAEALKGFDATWEAAKADAGEVFATTGETPQEFVRLSTLQITELDKSYKSAVDVVDALGSRQATPNCTGTGSATGGAICVAAASYVASVQVAMYCHEIARQLPQ